MKKPFRNSEYLISEWSLSQKAWQQVSLLTAAWGYLFRIAVVFLGILGLSQSIISAYGLKVPFFFTVYIAAFFLMLFAVFLQSKYTTVSVFLILAAYLIVIGFYPYPSEKLMDIPLFFYNNIIAKVANRGYYADNLITMPINDIIGNTMLYESYSRTCVVFLVMGFCGVFSLCLLKRVILMPCIFFGTLFLIPAFVFGLIPSAFSYGLITAAVCGVAVMGRYERIYFRNKENIPPLSENGKAALKPSSGFYSAVRQNMYRHGMHGYSAIASTLIFLVIISTIGVNTPGNSKLSLEKIRNNLLDFRNAIETQLYLDQSLVTDCFPGGSNGQILGSRNFEYANMSVMKVTSQVGKPIYLRGWIGATYQDNSWYALDENQLEKYDALKAETGYTDAMLKNFYQAFAPQTVGFENNSALQRERGFVYDEISVRLLKSLGNLIFLPSYSLQETIRGNRGQPVTIGDRVKTVKWKLFSKKLYTSTAMVALVGDSDFGAALPFYQKAYEKAVTLSENTFYADMEKNYRDFVYQNYTQTPKNLSPRISQLTNTITAGKKHPFEKAAAVAEYLATNYKYTLKPPAFDYQTQDFVDNFLFENPSGYCTYYATAMTVMLRSLGIPTRYVEGYRADFDGYETTTVKDKNAHAWTEVYFDGMGWFPFEPTAPYFHELQLSKGTPNQNEPSETESLISSDVSAVFESQGVESAAASENASSDTSSASSLISSISSVSSAVVSGPEEQTGHYQWGWMLAVVLVVLVIIMIPVTYLSLKTRLTKTLRMFAQMDSTLAVRHMYEFCLRLLRLSGFPPEHNESPTHYAARLNAGILAEIKPDFSQVMSVMLKAEFGGQTIPESERASVYAFIAALTDQYIWKRSILVRFYLMLLLGGVRGSKSRSS